MSTQSRCDTHDDTDCGSVLDRYSRESVGKGIPRSVSGLDASAPSTSPDALRIVAESAQPRNPGGPPATGAVDATSPTRLDPVLVHVLGVYPDNGAATNKGVSSEETPFGVTSVTGATNRLADYGGLASGTDFLDLLDELEAHARTPDRFGVTYAAAEVTACIEQDHLANPSTLGRPLSSIRADHSDSVGERRGPSLGILRAGGESRDSLALGHAPNHTEASAGFSRCIWCNRPRNRCSCFVSASRLDSGTDRLALLVELEALSQPRKGGERAA